MSDCLMHDGVPVEVIIRGAGGSVVVQDADGNRYSGKESDFEIGASIPEVEEVVYDAVTQEEEDAEEDGTIQYEDDPFQYEDLNE